MGCKGSRSERPPLIPSDDLERLLRKSKVRGVSLSWFEARQHFSQVAGWSDKKSLTRMSEDTWMSLGPMSQTVSAAFTVWCFQRRGVSLDIPVVRLLKQIGSRFLLQCVPGNENWIRLLTVRHLLQHTSGLSSYMLSGFPRSRLMPKPMQMMSGRRGFGNSAKLLLIKRPGTEFDFSDGNFVVLQHILMAMEGCSFNKALREFLDSCGMEACSFRQRLKETNLQHATGYYEDGRSVPGGRLMFSALAKGLSGTTRAYSKFLATLASAYGNQWYRTPISHLHAKTILEGRALNRRPAAAAAAAAGGGGSGSGAASGGAATYGYGLGTLLCRAGPNRIMYQIADTDGFRGVYMCCYCGPDARGGPSGFVILCNGSGNSVDLICAIAKNIILQLNWEGIDFSRVPAAGERNNAASSGSSSSSSSSSGAPPTGGHDDIMSAIQEHLVSAFIPS